METGEFAVIPTRVNDLFEGGTACHLVAGSDHRSGGSYELFGQRHTEARSRAGIGLH